MLIVERILTEMLFPVMIDTDAQSVAQFAKRCYTDDR